jgi:hypothetical protein
MLKDGSPKLKLKTNVSTTPTFASELNDVVPKMDARSILRNKIRNSSDNLSFLKLELNKPKINL